MSIIIHDNKTHEKTANLAEMTRQVAVSAAIAAGGGYTAVNAATKAAEATYYRSVIASCVANNVDAGAYRQGLHDVSGLWT
jgi:hypothetical protein